MSRGITIAELVQQVYYAIYKIRVDVDESANGAFHCKTNKFKEVVMEANLVLQELQKDADWNWLRRTWDMGRAENFRMTAPQRIHIPDDVYRVCTGYGDAVRLHDGEGYSMFQLDVPFTSPHQAHRPVVQMYNEFGEINSTSFQNRAFVTGDTLTFARPWFSGELGMKMETDVVDLLEPFHICDDSCEDHCPIAYEHVHLRQMPNPYYLIVKVAARRAEGDPSVSERAVALADEATKILSAMKEDDAAHTTPDFYETQPLGYVVVD